MGDSECAAGPGSALGQQQRSGCGVQIRRNHLERALVNSGSGTVLPTPSGLHGGVVVLRGARGARTLC